jgi:indole-3-glycerol phosphate synthase/phosphoribosylanthranilate isomerase
VTVLDRILDRARADLAARKASRPRFEPSPRPSERSFMDALRAPGRSLIAEFKPASPSRVALRSRDEVEEFARLYSGHASSMSVLCDRPHFDGGHDLLERARGTTDLPLLCKDFIFDDWQVREARAAGADAILLMAAVVDDGRLAELRAAAGDLGMDCLVEVHDQDEFERVMALDVPIVGVNSRNLHDLTIDPDRMNRLIEQVPADRVAVAESGIESRADVDALPARADAVLVGSALMLADDPRAKLRELGW